MTSDELVRELQKLPKGTKIRYLDFDEYDYKPGAGLNWQHLNQTRSVGIDFQPKMDVTEEQIMSRPAGFIIDVPVTLSVAVRGKPWEEAVRIARAFAEALNPSEQFIEGYSDEIGPGTITEATLESSTEEHCELLTELEAEEKQS